MSSLTIEELRHDSKEKKSKMSIHSRRNNNSIEKNQRLHETTIARKNQRSQFILCVTELYCGNILTNTFMVCPGKINTWRFKKWFHNKKNLFQRKYQKYTSWYSEQDKVAIKTNILFPLVKLVFNNKMIRTRWLWHDRTICVRWTHVTTLLIDYSTCLFKCSITRTIPSSCLFNLSIVQHTYYILYLKGTN